MTRPPVGIAVDLQLAIECVEQSLAEGTRLAELLATDLARFNSGLLLVPAGKVDPGRLRLDGVGRGIRATEADAVANQFLGQARLLGGRTLVVENDLARRGDPHLEVDSCFIGDRVIAWRALEERPAAATRLLRGGASGYPLNAVVSRLLAESIGLAPGLALSAAALERLARSVLAIIVSVFDAEAYVAIVEDWPEFV